jgi:hypothetical protein
MNGNTDDADRTDEHRFLNALKGPYTITRGKTRNKNKEH